MSWYILVGGKNFYKPLDKIKEMWYNIITNEISKKGHNGAVCGVAIVTADYSAV